MEKILEHKSLFPFRDKHLLQVRQNQEDQKEKVGVICERMTQQVFSHVSD